MLDCLFQKKNQLKAEVPFSPTLVEILPLCPAVAAVAACVRETDGATCLCLLSAPAAALTLHTERGGFCIYLLFIYCFYDGTHCSRRHAAHQPSGLPVSPSPSPSPSLPPAVNAIPRPWRHCHFLSLHL